ncbi:CoA transferase [Microbacterium sp. A93]|uniref:CaiB/BaiF CoA-transferase family protein n=1 Tax=Microbacterium sp. A93 TaxID=3450716 RepID=UPI003F423F11
MFDKSVLSDFVVLELAGDLGAAYCAKLLGEFGAKVIKVEPEEGEWIRTFGPTLANESDTSPLFMYANTGKSGVSIDPAISKDRRRLNELVARADIIVIGADGHRILADLGHALADLARQGKIITSLRAYGATGAKAGQVGYELDVFHSGGEGALLPGGLSYELFPDREPVKASRHLSDYDAGCVGAINTLALILRRLRSGDGAVSDISKQDVELSLGRVTIDRQLNQRIRVNRADRGYDFGGIFPCIDGFITVRPTQDKFWAAMANGIGMPELIDDPRFSTRSGRESNGRELDVIIREVCSRLRAIDLYEELAPLGVPVGYYADAEALVTSEHALKRGDLSILSQSGHDLMVPRPGYTFDGNPMPPLKAWPETPGVHNAEIDDWLASAESSTSTLTTSAGDRKIEPHLPLSGVRVLDLTWVAAGPYATELLAMLGATVVKVESSNRPDLFRQMAGNDTPGLNSSARFNSVNLGKSSLGLDFKTNEGRALLRDLALSADVVFSNYRAGVLENLGLSYDDLKAERPELVVTCISNGGRGGTDPGYVGYASNFNSMGGLGHLTGYSDGPPTEVRDSIDLRVGTVAVIGTVAALVDVDRRGRGGSVDVSAQQAITGLVGDSVIEYQVTGERPHRNGNGLYNEWPYGVYACDGDDEWLAIATHTQQERDALGGVVGIDLVTAAQSDAGREAAERQIRAWVSRRVSSRAAEELSLVGVACSKVMNGPDLLDDVHLAERGLLRSVKHPTLDDQIIVGAPWLIDGASPELQCAPDLGADTDSVLADWLDLSPNEIDRLSELRAIEGEAVYL